MLAIDCSYASPLLLEKHILSKAMRPVHSELAAKDLNKTGVQDVEVLIVSCIVSCTSMASNLHHEEHHLLHFFGCESHVIKIKKVKKYLLLFEVSSWKCEKQLKFIYIFSAYLSIRNIDKNLSHYTCILWKCHSAKNFWQMLYMTYVILKLTNICQFWIWRHTVQSRNLPSGHI